MATRAHLTSLAMGEVTPKWFHHSHNTQILLTFGYPPTKTLLECTARWWLIKLGWWCTMLRKGVYMDGHERPDVVEYRKNDFLPLMALHKKNMVQWLANGTNRVDPKLGP